MAIYTRKFYLVRADSRPQKVSKPTAVDYSLFLNDALEMYVFYVGSGEAILLRRGQSGFMIDCGEGSTRVKNEELGKKVYGFLKDEGIRLGAVVASHPHQDHLNAFPYVLEELAKDGHSMIPFYYNGDLDQRSHKNIVDTGTVKPVSAKPQKKVNFLAGAAKGVFLVDDEPPSYRKIASAFLHVTYREATFLFTGDVRRQYELKIAERLKKLGKASIQVLKITHHGSSSGSSADFVLAVQPRISVSSSNYPRDHKLEDDVRSRLSQTGEALATYEPHKQPHKRDVIIRTDGKTRTLDVNTGILFEVVATTPQIAQ